MRLVSKFLAAGAATAALVALTAGPALADPPSGTVPRDTDAVSVGANTTEFLFDQLSNEYNGAHSGGDPLWYSWDATNPVTGAIGDQIVTKAGCTSIARPDGTGQGISALEANAEPSGDTSNYCVDFARASAGRTSSEPACATGGICFVALAGDAVTWATRDTASGGSDAPASLTQAQLAAIYECTDTNWDQVGGQNAPIQAYLPITSAGTRTFWLLALGGGSTPITPGSCVSDLATQQDPGGTLEENEGYNSVFNSPESIFIYSVGDYISQAYRSAPCLNSGCTPNSSNQVCTPTSTENAFGCNLTGYLGINPITPPKAKASSPPMELNPSINIATTAGTTPGTTNVDLPDTPSSAGSGSPAPWTLNSFAVTQSGSPASGFTGTMTGSPADVLQITAADSVAAGKYEAKGTLTDGYGNTLPFTISITVKTTKAKTEKVTAVPVINGLFPVLFQRSLYDVVRYDPNTTDHIPGPESGAPGGINLEQFLGASGYACTNSTAQAQIKDYGFLTKWELSTCGTVN
jgi:ABC-type phosphate transport system substrate-binding protein